MQSRLITFDLVSPRISWKVYQEHRFPGSTLEVHLKKKIIYVFIFRERVRGGEREREKHQCVVASCTPPTRDLADKLGMCPDWESDQQPFGS